MKSHTFVGTSRPSLKRMTVAGLGGVAVLQAAVMVVLGIAAWLKRRHQPQGFPRADFPATRVGENHLRLYSYGRELYDAMLAAIDSAHESIYLETFIWKGD